MNDKRDNRPVTIGDLNHFGQTLKREIVDEVAGLLGEVMNVMGTEFSVIRGKFAELKSDFRELAASQQRAEQKLDPTIMRVDILAKDVAFLKTRPT